MLSHGGISAPHDVARFVAVSIGVVLLVLLGIVHRRARAQRELDEAERLIAERFGPQ